MATHDIIVIGASAGGVEALTQFVRALPPDLPAAIFIVLHIAPYSKSLLPTILNRRSSLTALWSALRALKEQSNLVRRMAERAKKQNHPLITLRYEQQAQEAEFHAETLRKLLLDGNKEDEPLPENNFESS